MTAINLATDIPSGITTVEQLAAWSMACLSTLNRGVVALEGPNFNEQVASAGIFYVAAADKHRYVGRISLETDPDYIIGHRSGIARKPWFFAKEISTKVLTSDMKAN
jgi:hypothetical protein